MIILIIHIIVSYDQNISFIFFYEKDGSHVRLWHPSCVYITAQTVHCSTKDVYTSEITFLALHPCSPVSTPLLKLTKLINNKLYFVSKHKWTNFFTVIFIFAVILFRKKVKYYIGVSMGRRKMSSSFALILCILTKISLL